MVTHLLKLEDKIKLVYQVDELKKKMPVSDAMKKLGMGSRDRYFEARKWLKANGYIDDDEEWTGKARDILEILRPIIGGQAAKMPPGGSEGPREERQAPPHVTEEVSLGARTSKAPDGQAHDQSGARAPGAPGQGAYRYDDRGGKARIFVTISSDDVFKWILQEHESSGKSIASIAYDLIYKGYKAEINS